MARVLMWLLCLLVALAPAALGSNRALPWSYNALAAGALGVLAAAVIWRERAGRIPFQGWLVAWPMILWLAGLAYALLQVVPAGSLGLAHPAWQVTDGLIGDSLHPSISVNQDATLASVMRLATYLVVFLSAFVLSRTPDRAAFLLRAFVLSACVYGLYGLLLYASAADKILWFDQVSPHSLTSTFINRNSAATYFGIAACASISLLIRRVRHVLMAVEEEGNVLNGFERFLSGFAGRLGVELVIFALLMGATLLTLSRAGVMATLVAIIAGLVLVRMRQGRHGGGSAPLVLVALLAVGAAVAGLQVSAQRVLDRVLGTGTGVEERASVYQDTLAAIGDNAWLGTGLGTFQDVFPLYRIATPASPVVWDKAHSDYLELLLGLGIPVAAMMLLALAMLIWRCFRGALGRRRNSHLPIAGAMAGLLVAIHAAFDFSLQIQAVALSLALVLGIGVAQSVSDRSAA